MSIEIDIRNLNIRNVIEELWKYAEYSSIYNDSMIKKPDFNWEQGIKNVKPGGYLENFCGKTLNIIVSSNSLNIIGYDHKYGKGQAHKIISNLSSI